MPAKSSTQNMDCADNPVQESETNRKKQQHRPQHSANQDMVSIKRGLEVPHDLPHKPFIEQEVPPLFIEVFGMYILHPFWNQMLALAEGQGSFYLLFTFLLKSLHSLQFCFENLSFSSLFLWNLYILLTFVLKSLLVKSLHCVHFSTEVSASSSLLY